MLPLASGAIIVLRRQLGVVSGTEKRLCLIGFWLVVSLFLIRDIYLSDRMRTTLSIDQATLITSKPVEGSSGAFRQPQ